jgi:hypothetical protein
VQDVGLDDADGDVAVGVRGAVVLQHQREQEIKLKGHTLMLKHYGAAHTDSDISVRIVEADIEVLARVRVGEDLRPFRVQPRVAVRVVEVPVRIDPLPRQVFSSEQEIKLKGHTLMLKHYGAAHTDSDISSTRCALARCLRVFAWARISAPSAFSHALPSVWSNSGRLWWQRRGADRGGREGADRRRDRPVARTDAALSLSEGDAG